MELRIGEMVILRDYPDAKDWYVAEISQVLSDRFTVNGYITVGLPLAGYARASKGARVKSMEGISFLRTWCKDKGKGIATTIPPKHLKGQEKYLWTWRLPVGETDQLLLVRNVRLVGAITSKLTYKSRNEKVRQHRRLVQNSQAVEICLLSSSSSSQKKLPLEKYVLIDAIISILPITNGKLPCPSAR
jgi:hypothetical protein